jgi:hypothetical protein
MDDAESKRREKERGVAEKEERNIKNTSSNAKTKKKKR